MVTHPKQSSQFDSRSPSSKTDKKEKKKSEKTKIIISLLYQCYTRWLPQNETPRMIHKSIIWKFVWIVQNECETI